MHLCLDADELLYDPDYHLTPDDLWDVIRDLYTTLGYAMVECREWRGTGLSYQTMRKYLDFWSNVILELKHLSFARTQHVFVMLTGPFDQEECDAN